MATAAVRRLSGNLPAPSTGFVGRRRESAEIRRLLSESRLVTLTGPGGVGKTRLALHVAEGVRRAFPDGTWMADLAPLDEPALVAQSVAAALGIRDHSARWPVAILSEHLADKCLLLVLDNCEHLLDASAVLADAMLQATPELRILATSRQPLGLAGEQIVDVAPLSVPDPDAVTSVQELSTFGAVSLFVARAAGVLPEFTLTERNALAVAALRARLDGLPLAIELSAVRLRVLSPEQVLERLDERFQLLTGGSRAALARQQTLLGLVDWSFQLCSSAERLLWARASVFAGSFDLDAAEQVCSDDALPCHEVLDVVAGLIDKSVLLREDHETGVRYRMLETIREFGRERLAEAADELTLRRRHGEHFLRLIERACAGLFSSEGPQWLDRLLAVDAAPTPARAHALWANGALAILQGDVDTARTMLAESFRLAERLADDKARAYAEVFSGHVAMVEGDVGTAVRLLEHAMEAHRVAGDPFGTAVTLIRMALAASAIGDGERASRLAIDYVALCTEHGATWLAPFGHFVLAVEYWRRDETGQDVAAAREAVRGHWDNQDRIGTGQGIEVLAWAAAAEGNGQRAACLLGALDMVWRSVGAPLFGFPHLVQYHDDCRTNCKSLLGSAAFDAAAHRGAGLPFDDVVAYALEQSTPTESSAGAAGPSPLTRREREVADLVAQGMSNKQIVAQRTAESHVEHILTKLGFTSRAQIATWVTARKHEEEVS